jgi:hypothetical protein
LPVTWKYYISIMAVSCYDCEYLLKILEEQFLLYGGEVTWLTDGLKKTEPKLERLSDLSELMAFRPWSIDASTIESLASSDLDPSLRWSIPELMHAGAILSQYHSLCGLIFGQGIKEDVDIALNFDKHKSEQIEINTGSAEYHTEEEKTIDFLKKKQ